MATPAVDSHATFRSAGDTLTPDLESLHLADEDALVRTLMNHPASRHIDPDAVRAAQLNAQANHVALNLGLPDVASGTYPLVVANILAAPLKVLAPLLCSHVAPGGTLLLAGILERQTEEIQTAYQSHLTLHVVDSQDGWVLMRGMAL